MSNSFSKISGNYSTTGNVINLVEYDTYLKKVTKEIADSQAYIINIANLIKNNVMKETIWYNDIAVEFAKWWNDTKGKNEGLICLKTITNIMEQIINVTGVKVATQMAKSTVTNESVLETQYAKLYIGKLDPYNILGVQNISKNILNSKLPEETTSSTYTLDWEPLIDLANRLNTNFNSIDQNIEKISKLVSNYLLDGKVAIKLSDLDPSSLKAMVNKVKTNTNLIRQKLVEILRNAAEGNEESYNLFVDTLSK